MRFFRDLYYAMMTGALIGTAIGLHQRRARERREAYARQVRPVPPVIRDWNEARQRNGARWN